jgi:hypothetical protein
VGAPAARPAGRSTAPQPPLLTGFAGLLRERYGARLYLFGSRARGDNRPDSDYDLVAVSDAFGEQPRFGRAPDRRDLWRAAGGRGIALDLHCRTNAEFRQETRDGFGAIGWAHSRGELQPVR